VVHCCHWVPVFLIICHMCGSCFHWLLVIFTSRQGSGWLFFYICLDNLSEKRFILLWLVFM
jgi:hypothetical protein